MNEESINIKRIAFNRTLLKYTTKETHYWISVQRYNLDVPGV